VIIPYVNVQPQLSISSLFEIEKMISEIPENKKDTAKNTESATYDAVGNANV